MFRRWSSSDRRPRAVGDESSSGIRRRTFRKRLDFPSRADLPRDLLAGLTVGATQVGNSMAYTMLAGVPPVHGLYAVMVGAPTGALTASSERMSIVPTAVLSLAAGGALAALPPQQRVVGMLTLAVLTGTIMLVAGLLRAGSLVRFISNAVMVGFMAGISVTILLGQLAALTGFSSPYDNKLEKAADIVVHLGRVDLPTTVIGLTTVLLVVVLRWTRLRFFAMAIALVVLTVAVALLDIRSVAVVGDIAPIPRSLPMPHLPELSLAPSLLLSALSLAIIGLVQGAGISRTVPNSDGTLGNSSRDFVGQGVANVVSGFFSGGVVGGSVQATALDIGAGARSRWSTVFAGIFVILVVLVAAPVVQQVPLAVTAGILMVTASSALRPSAAREIWRADKLSAAVMVITFILVLVIPLQYAVLVGAAISVMKYIYLSSLDVRVVEVKIGEEARAKETSCPRSLSDATVTVLDIYGSLFFAAAPTLKESLPAVDGARGAIVVLRLRGRGTLHSATIALIRDYAGDLAADGGRLYLAGVGPEMEDQLRRTGLMQILGSDAVVPATDEAYGSCEVAQCRGRTWLETHSDGHAISPGAS